MDASASRSTCAGMRRRKSFVTTSRLSKTWLTFLAAYDTLARHPAVDLDAIGVIGSSYGGYLAGLLTRERPVRWLALRVPALYKDEHWTKAKAEIDRAELERFRHETISTSKNRALSACNAFRGDVCLVESEHDDFVPHAVIASYRAAFRHAKSLTYRRIDGADHSLTETEHRRAYSSILVSWASEMVFGFRESPEIGAEIGAAPDNLPASEA